jgi:ABC-type polysaccharide/polyol phosphate export permease
MDWTAPYLLVALGCYAALELWFVAMMIATGHRYRVVPQISRVGTRMGVVAR